MNNSTDQLIAFLREYDGINDKAKLAKLVSDNFHLTKDRSVSLDTTDKNDSEELLLRTKGQQVLPIPFSSDVNCLQTLYSAEERSAILANCNTKIFMRFGEK